MVCDFTYTLPNPLQTRRPRSGPCSGPCSTLLGILLEAITAMGLLSIFSPHGGRNRKRKKPQVPRVVEDTLGRSVTRSVGGFALGMVLATAYGAMVIFVQGYNIWYCLLSTITLALGLGLGMAFSCKVRVTVLLMLPQIFSSKCGKTQDK